MRFCLLVVATFAVVVSPAAAPAGSTLAQPGSHTDAAAATITLTASPNPVTYGPAFNRVSLKGRHSSGEPDVSVELWAKRFGEASFRKVDDIQTSDNGVFSWVLRLNIQTAYRARVVYQGETSTSDAVTVNIRPFVSFARTVDRRFFFTHVNSLRTYRGKVVVVQRKNTAGRWVALRRVTVKSERSATFRLELPRGSSHLRVYVPSGRGYVAGISSTLIVTR